MSAAQLVKRHSAGVANYPGDVRSMVGEIKGPTTYGGYVVAVAAVYDAEQDRTQVAFGHALDTDLPRALVTDGGETLRLPGVALEEATPCPR